MGQAVYVSIEKWAEVIEGKLNEVFIAAVSFHYLKALLVKHHLEDDMQPLVQGECRRTVANSRRTAPTSLFGHVRCKIELFKTYSHIWAQKSRYRKVPMNLARPRRCGTHLKS